MSAILVARSDRRSRSVGPCAGGGSQLRAVVSGRGLAASPVGAPGRALTTRAAGPGSWCTKLMRTRPSGSGQHLGRDVAVG